MAGVDPTRKGNGRVLLEGESTEGKLAPGLDGVEGLNAPATEQEVQRGDSTTVTRLVWDEVDPSEGGR
ncbi:MAG: hypothetical protein K6T78_09725 [Alicyclobacillus sp.]|nr:hypothetical protein [Alicyclobacillus sp.]